MARHYDWDTRRPLTGEEASRTPPHNMVRVCVDLMVDNAPPGAREALGFVPVDEKMIGHALVGGLSDEVDGLGARVLLPRPEVLLAAKISSVRPRAEGHKKWKDIADMYALAWHSGVETGELRAGVLGLAPKGMLAKALGAIGDDGCGRAAEALGAGAGHVRAVLGGFLGGGGAESGRAADSPAAPPPAGPGGGAGRAGVGGKWPTPYALGYDRFSALVRAPGDKAGGGREARLRDIAAAASVGEHNAAINLSFLESVGVARESGRGSYGLTEAGERYAGAHLSGSRGRIKRESRAVVGGSHLRRLADEARANPGMRRGDLLLRIKEYAGRPGGPGAGNMQWPASTGAGTLLRVLGDAGMLPPGGAGA